MSAFLMFLILAPLLLVGLAFNILGAVSLYRFPDVYTRLHGTTKCTTFGTIFTCFGVLAWALWRLGATGDGRFLTMALHVGVAVVALLVTNATGAHAIARAAHRSGVGPRQAGVDRLAEDRRKGGGA